MRNLTDYDTSELRRLVLATLRDGECDNVAVTVVYSRSAHATGNYREWWYSKQGETRPQIRVRLPRPGVGIHDYTPYPRRHAPEPFPLPDWQTALVAVVAHEAQHHRQTPRNHYGRTRKRGRYVEVECDLAALRAVRRMHR